MKPVGIALLIMLVSSVTLAQEPEFKILFRGSYLERGPGDPVDSMAGLSLQPGERECLGSLGPERLDALLLEALNLRRPCAAVDFLEAGANPNGVGQQRGLPLWYASGSHTDELVRLLLFYGADPNVVRVDGRTALMRAASFGRSTTVRLLLDAGADPNGWDRDGKTALYYAIAGKHDECVEMLGGMP